MKTLRPILVLWALAVACAFAALFTTGCAHTGGLVTAKVRIQAGTNVVEIRQPKDTTIDRLTFDPVHGTLKLEGYASAGNAAAIATARAQAEAQERLATRAFELGGQIGATVARAYGIPLSGQTLAPGFVQTSPASVWTIPDPPAGMKWVLGTNGIPRLAPKDDPSTPTTVP